MIVNLYRGLSVEDGCYTASMLSAGWFESNCAVVALSLTLSLTASKYPVLHHGIYMTFLFPS